MLNDAASTGALRAALLWRDIGPERAVAVMRPLGDSAIRQLLATLTALPAQDAAGAARLLLNWMPAHG